MDNLDTQRTHITWDLCVYGTPRLDNITAQVDRLGLEASGSGREGQGTRGELMLYAVNGGRELAKLLWLLP